MVGEAYSKKLLRGPSGTRAEQLKGWLAEARKEEATAAKVTEGSEVDIGKPGGDEMEGNRETETKKEMTHWEKVVALVRAAFGEGRLEEEATWKAVVLISKGKGDYRGIGLVEMVWKVVAAILNSRITAYITHHEFLHGLRAGRGKGTATLEAKLLQKLLDMREEVLYVIFLDLHKVYETLDRYI